MTPLASIVSNIGAFLFLVLLLLVALVVTAEILAARFGWNDNPNEDEDDQ